MERMNWGQKLLEVFIQFGLIFYSVFIFYLTWSLILSIGAYFLEEAFLEKWKDFKPEAGTTYHVKPSYRVEEGLFDDVKVVYDDGKRTQMSGDQKLIIFMIIFLPIFRCISFLLSIIALILPPLNVKVENDSRSYANIMLDVYWCKLLQYEFV